MTSKSAGGNNSKNGRNAEFCVRYRNRGTRELNKARKIERHCKRFPADKQAARWFA